MNIQNNNRKYYLVRTHRDLVEKSIVGVGWSDFDFSNPKYGDTEILIKDIDNNIPGGIGRWGNQVRRFCHINEGDVIIAPFSYCLAIGIAGQELFYDSNYHQTDRANQRHVKFNFDEGNKLKTISRTMFSEAFQRRLRVRGMTVNDISEFKDEIDHAITDQSEGKAFSWSNAIEKMLDEKEKDFKNGLFKNIQNGQTNLQAGGIGLEYLVKELLTIEGYDAAVLSKKAFTSIADADVKASKIDKFCTVNLLVQVKHHQGVSGDWGIKQLEEIKKILEYDYSDYMLVFITSAEVTSKLKEDADLSHIRVIDGHELVDWIYDNLDALHEDTKSKLGICEVPTLTAVYKK